MPSILDIKLSFLTILTGEDVLDSTPAKTVSSLSNPFIFLPNDVINASLIESFNSLGNKLFKLLKVYSPTIISATFTLGTMVLGHHTHHKREAALMSSLNIAHHALYEYRDVVKDIVKPKQYEEIEERRAAKVVERISAPPIERDIRKGSEDEIIQTGKGNQLFYDPVTGSQFRANAEWIRHQLFELSHDMVFGNEMFADVDEYARKLRIYKKLAAGGILGWNAEDGEIKVDFRWKTYTNPTTGTDEPIGIMDIYPQPHDNYVPNLHG